ETLLVSVLISVNRYIPTPMMVNPVRASFLYLPVRVTNWPVIALKTTMLKVMNIMTNPLLAADVPITPWIKKGIYMMAPNMPIPIRKPMALDREKTLFLNKYRGRTGLVTRRSVMIKRTKATTDAVNRPKISTEVQLYWFPAQVKANSSGIIVQTKNNDP